MTPGELRPGLGGDINLTSRANFQISCNIRQKGVNKVWIVAQKPKNTVLIHPSSASLRRDSKSFLNGQERRGVTDPIAQKLINAPSPWLGAVRNHFPPLHWNRAFKVPITSLVVTYELLWGGFCITG